MAMRYVTNVATLELNQDKCVGCGLCEIVCPHSVFAIEGNKAHVADRDACMECGACARNCPVQAIAVQAGVGCAAAIVHSMLTGGQTCCEPTDAT